MSGGRLPLGRDLGDIAARVGDQGVVTASKGAMRPKTLRVALAATDRCQVSKATGLQVGRHERRAAEMRLAKWLRFSKRHHGLA